MKRIFLKKLIIAISTLSLVFCLCFSIATAAAPYDKLSSTAFPFEIEFDTEVCKRLCYAGHSASGVRYRDGIAAAPYTMFKLEPLEGSAPGTDTEGVSVTVSLIYENDDKSASVKETIMEYREGDLDDGDSYYVLLDETNIENLSERGRLYSDSLSSIELTFSYTGLRNKTYTETIYVQVCEDEELSEYLLNEAD